MKFRVLYIGFILLTAVNGSFAQWMQTDGPYSSVKISSLFTNNNQLYASTPCGLHSTGNLGDRWHLKSTLEIETFIKKGNLVYFGGKSSGFKLLDLSDPDFIPLSHGRDGVTVITIKDGDTCLYASIEEEGFFKSKGYSKEWVSNNRGLPADPRDMNPGVKFIYHVNSIEILGNRVFSATHKGVYQAEIGNDIVWYRVYGLPAENAQLIKEIDGNLYAGMDNNLYYSSDKGATWELRYTAGFTISFISSINNILYITTTGGGIIASADNGLSWKTLNNGLTDLNVTTLISVNNTLICGTATKGVFYFDDAAWVNYSKGIICSDIWSMAATKTSLAANAEKDVYLATGKVSSWPNISPTVERSYFGSVTAMNGMILLAYKNNSDQFIKYYNPLQKTWSDLESAVPYVGEDTYKMAVSGKTIYVYDDNHLYSTDDLALTWNDLTIPGQFCDNISDLVIYKNTPFAAACGNGEMLRLSDTKEWALSNNGLPPERQVGSIANSSNAIYAYALDDGIYVSQDDGDTWTKASNGFSSSFDIRSFAYVDDNIFVTSAKGVFYSKDFGQNWIQMNDGLKNMDVGPIAVFNDTLYVGSHGNGIWKHEISDFIKIKKDTASLMQTIKIFPNPASDYVRFDFTDFNTAQISIMDILGREMISTKLGSDKTIDVGKLTNGTYILVISASNYIYTSKLVISKYKQ